MNRNVLLLAISQALANSAPPAVVLLGGIIGADLAPTPRLATLPVSVMILGVAIFTIPASILMQKIGRRAGFTLATLVAAAGSVLAAYAIGQRSFELFCAAILALGANGAFVQQYRFAAAESVSTQQAGRAVSIVLLGGIFAGYFGPEIANRTRDLSAMGLYSGSFLTLALMNILAAASLFFLRDVAVSENARQARQRPLLAVFSQPVYLVALLAGASGYGIMSFIMTATPVQMHTMNGFSLSDTTFVIQSHMIAMFIPSFFSGYLIDRIGVVKVMGLGVGAMLVCVFLGMIGRVYLQYWGALVLLGMGWNFLFIGATVLLTRSYEPSERFKAQAVNDFVIFGTQALASLSAGTVLFSTNWQTLNLINIPVLLFVLLVIFVLRRRLSTAAPAKFLAE